MGFMDKAKQQADKAKQKATDFVNKNPDKVNNVINKGADFIDKQTKGKYSDKIRKGQSAANQRLRGHGGSAKGPRQT